MPVSTLRYKSLKVWFSLVRGAISTLGQDVTRSTVTPCGTIVWANVGSAISLTVPWDELTSEQQGQYQDFVTVAACQLTAAIVNGRGRV
jgi:hypothetical protein